MKLLIFGASGSVGQHLVSQALEQEHTVTAFTRNDKGFEDSHYPNLNFFRGNVLNFDSVAEASKDQDAIFCVLGAGRKGNVRADGTFNIVKAMEEQGVNRLISLSTLGAGDSYDNLNFFWKKIMFGWFLKEAYKDHQLQEKYIMQSELDWTVVRPAAFTDGPLTRKYRYGFTSHDKTLKMKVSRADVAHFMLKQIEMDQYIQKAPGLSY